MSREFFFNPKDPKKSFDVYKDKNKKDTIPIKYATLSDTKQTIRKLERLYKGGSRPHKRISQVAMIMSVRLRIIDPKDKRTLLAKRYVEFLKERTKEKKEKERKKMKFKLEGK